MKIREVMLTAAGCAAGRLAGKINAMICCVGRGKKGVKYGCDRV